MTRKRDRKSDGQFAKRGYGAEKQRRRAKKQNMGPLRSFLYDCKCALKDLFDR